MGGPYLDKRACDQMARALPACQSLVKACYGASLSLSPSSSTSYRAAN